MHSASHQPIVVPPGEGTGWQVLGEIMTRKIASGETGGAYAVVEEVTPPQGGPPLHCHRHEDELFYVLEGELDVQCGDRRFTASSGTVAVFPRDIPHTFHNRSATPSRVVVIIMPGGFEQLFCAGRCARAGWPPVPGGRGAPRGAAWRSDCRATPRRRVKRRNSTWPAGDGPAISMDRKGGEVRCPGV